MTLLGEEAPAFTVDSTAGAPQSLDETLPRGPTVVLINRGSWCSYCAEQLQTFSELHYDLWRHHGVDIIPILNDPVSTLVEMRDRFQLTFQLHSDPDGEVARAYTGLERDDIHGSTPIPGTFIVDENGTVRYEHVSEKPADRTYANYVRHLIKTGYEPPYADFEYERIS